MNKLRRLIRTHAELLLNAAFCAIAIVCLLLGYGERQQADEQAQITLAAQNGGGKTADAAQ